MAKQFSYTTEYGIVLPDAYGKLDSVKLYALAGMAELTYQVYASKEARDQYPSLAPVRSVIGYISGDDYVTFYSMAALSAPGVEIFGQSYLAYDAQLNNFFAANNAVDV